MQENWPKPAAAGTLTIQNYQTLRILSLGYSIILMIKWGCFYLSLGNEWNLKGKCGKSISSKYV